MKKIVFGFIAFTLIALIGCQKDKEDKIQNPPSQMELWNCHTETIWHDETIFDELLGKWQWYYNESFGTSEEGVNTENENIVVEFKSDSSLNVFIDGELTASANWIVTLIDAPLFGVVMDSTISQLLNGRILFCDDILEFNNSYIDGDDNYFKRLE